MRKYLLPETGNDYKANLHCHSTLSDGHLTPAEIAELYRRHGYSVVAFTDHNVQIPHPELKTDDFLPLTGYEINVREKGENAKLTKTCHLCLISLDDEDPMQPIFTASSLKRGAIASEPLVKRDRTKPDYVRVYSADGVNDMIRIGRENGYFVTYNHPTWSLEDYTDYMNYHGMHAMEIFNTGCNRAGYPEYNARVYDDMLRGGERIFCVAADDNHNNRTEDDPNYDSFGGWVVIRADKLDYPTIAKALRNGDFYASTGPEINALWFEDGKIHVECSDAARISLITGMHYCKSVGRRNEPLTAAEFEVPRECKWFRIDVVDGRGNHADTNAFFTDGFTFPAEN